MARCKYGEAQAIAMVVANNGKILEKREEEVEERTTMTIFTK